MDNDVAKHDEIKKKLIEKYGDRINSLSLEEIKEVEKSLGIEYSFTDLLLLQKKYPNPNDLDEEGKEILNNLKKNLKFNIRLSVQTDHGIVPIDEAAIRFIDDKNNNKVTKTMWLHDGIAEQVYEEYGGTKYRLDEDGNKIYFFENQCDGEFLLPEESMGENEIIAEEIVRIRKRESGENNSNNK